MVELLGLTGNGLLALCGLPLAFTSIITGKTEVTDSPGGTMFIWMWWWGEILSLLYNVGALGFDPYLTINYGINIVSVTTILFYTYNPRGENK